MSTNAGKKEIVAMLKDRFEQGSTALDVGAMNGKWFKILGDYFKMDAVEVFAPSIKKYKLEEKYEKVFCKDIKDFCKEDFFYDVIIMGDILEHLTPEDAKKVVEALYPKCKELLIAVPYKSKRLPHYGNEWERHLQTDLTDEIFMDRYKGFKRFYYKRLWDLMRTGYGVYIKDEQKKSK